jgi:xanthine dehydrogenase FAD-binding subunit
MENKGGDTMIPFDFDYYRPNTFNDAIAIYNQVEQAGQKAIYYNGGTEIITFGRTNKMQSDVVIDIKGIPECHVNEMNDNQLIIGASVSLNKLAESKHFPLLGETVRKIADHTSRNKITLGGNLLSQLNYRESILPLLISSSNVCIISSDGEQIIPIEKLLESGISPGSILAQIYIDYDFIHCPYISVRRTRLSKIGYPLVSIAAIKWNGKIRLAVSGLCAHPFHSKEMESILNELDTPVSERVNKALTYIPMDILDDILGSAAYRRFMFEQSVLDVLELFKEEIV